MRVLVLGGTGSIGAPITREPMRRGHDVWALARSEASAAKLREFSAIPLAGDIAVPERWAVQLPQVDAVIHAACDFEAEMGAIDLRLPDVLLPALAAQPKKPRFIYTGGAGCSARPAARSRRRRRRFAPSPPSPGWCRSCGEF